MPAVADHPCPACYRRHVLYLADGDSPDTNRKYAYQCPGPSGFAVRLVDQGEAWKLIEGKTAGAIERYEMK